jgi:hypothetical protein
LYPGLSRKYLTMTIIVIFISALKGVNGSSYTDFSHFIQDFRTIKSDILCLIPSGNKEY